MLTRRRMSLPFTEHTAKGQNSSSHGPSDAGPIAGGASPTNHLPTAVAAAAASPSPVQNQRLIARAESLARMTFELNIRSVSHQTDRLQRELATLIRATEDDKEYRKQNEARLQELFQELVVLRHYMGKVEDDRKTVQVSQDEYEKCQSETLAMVEEFRGEVRDLKELVEGLSKHMEGFPSATATTTNSAESEYASRRVDADSLGRDDMNPTQKIERYDSMDSHDGWLKSSVPCSEELVIEGYDAAAVADAARRVSEAIQSTRRWHHDHKTTKLADDLFCVNYLKQQSKRDAKAAVYIQRGILRRIRRTRERSASKPKSLEEFCRGVKWEDVIITVQETLIQDGKSAIVAII